MSSVARAYRSSVTALALTALVGLVGGGSLASKQIDYPGSTIKSTLQRTWDAQDRTPPGLDAVIERFEVSGETVPAAVVRLANEHGVLVGLYVVPWPETPWPEPLLATEKPLTAVSATFEKATVAQILNGLVTLDPRFAWWEDRGVINVALASTVHDPAHPLNVPLPLFEADKVPYLVALAGDPEWRDRIVPGPLLEEVYLVTGLVATLFYFGPPVELYPPVTISAKGWTTVEILNEMARQLKISWDIVDLRLWGGSHTVFWMEINLYRLPKGTPVAAAPPKAGTQRTAQRSNNYSPEETGSGGCLRERPARSTEKDAGGGWIQRRLGRAEPEGYRGAREHPPGHHGRQPLRLPEQHPAEPAARVSTRRRSAPGSGATYQAHAVRRRSVKPTRQNMRCQRGPGPAETRPG